MEVFFKNYGLSLGLFIVFYIIWNIILAVKISSSLLSFRLFNERKSSLEAFLTLFINNVIACSIAFPIAVFFACQAYWFTMNSDYFAFLVDFVLVDCGNSDNSSPVSNHCDSSCPPAPVYEKGYPRCVAYKKCGEYARKLYACWTLCGPRMEDHIMQKPFWQFWPKKYVDVRQVREAQLLRAEEAIAFQNSEENGLKQAMINGLTNNWVKRWGFGIVGCFCLVLFFATIVVGHILTALLARFF